MSKKITLAKLVSYILIPPVILFGTIALASYTPRIAENMQTNYRIKHSLHAGDLDSNKIPDLAYRSKKGIIYFYGFEYNGKIKHLTKEEAKLKNPTFNY